MLLVNVNHFHLHTRNTWLAKPREAGAGWKALFTRIVAWNEEIKRFLNIATILMSMVFSYFHSWLVCGWNLFLTRRNVQRACSAVVFDKFISHGKLFYRGHKTCNFFNAIFHKKDFWKKGKRFCRAISIQWILMNIAVEIWSGTEHKTFPMYANFAPA